MIVLVLGASGFIGSAVVDALRAAGHRVIEGRRRSSEGLDEDTVAVDFTRDFDAATWRSKLRGVDAVVNAVGILRESGVQTFDALHVRAPRALFAACVDAGVSRVVQLSALGADEHAISAYHVSKRRADEFLAAQSISSAIVQPSLVYGPGGESARLFDTLASLPWIPLPGDGLQRVQPIHLDDVVACIVALLERERWRTGRIALVGSEPTTVRGYLAALGRALGRARVRFIRIPYSWVRAAASLGRMTPGALLDHETLTMLERGNVADVADTQRILGAPPRPIAHFIPRRVAPIARQRAQLNWLLPLLRVTIAAMWIVTGIVSVGVYPVSDSYALLARTGITGTLATAALVGAASLDIALGIATLLAPSRFLWWSQITLILAYTLIITLWLPEFWAHPYGPVLKNLPILAALLLLAFVEER
ncbi:MAG TPA: SDR family oxidoreductase [Burkholderiaceae bacterium]|nr:SDR family oxidoreductase [Burkholderiaceae bacterium]